MGALGVEGMDGRGAGAQGTVDETAGAGSGKLILFGEHAAVFGFPAVGVPLPERTRVIFHGPPLRFWDFAGIPYEDQGIMRHLLDRLDVLLPKLSAFGRRAVRIESVVARGVGFGSSAALCTATAAAAIELVRGVTPSVPSHAWQLAHELERIFHGTPSGIDTGLSFLPGVTAFSPRPPELPAWERLECTPLWLVVGALPRSASSGALIRGIGERMRIGDPAVRNALSTLGAIAAQAKKTLGAKAALRVKPALGIQAACQTESMAAEIGKLADEAMRILGGLGLSDPSLDLLLEEGRRSGAVGGKLSGAGGGGAFFLVCGGAQIAEETTRTLAHIALRRNISFAATPRVLRVGGETGI